MDSGEATRAEAVAESGSPGEVHSRRLLELGSAQAAETRRERLLGYSKLFLAGITLTAAALLLRQTRWLELLIVPVAVFLTLAVAQEKAIRRIRFRGRAIHFHERALARIEDRWAGSGETGERFLVPEHPYARDLDLFGPASMFELLCTARTKAGEETLAEWLLTAARPEEIVRRQEGVRDLRERLQFRENLFSLGETVRLGVHPEAIAAWGERGPIFASRATRITTLVLALAWLGSMGAWAIGGFGYAAAAVTILNLGWAHRLYRRLDEGCALLEKAADDLQVLAVVLQLLEKEKFSAGKLLELQGVLSGGGIPASNSIRKLARLAEYSRSRHSLFLRPLDLVLFWSAQLVFAAERWQRQFGPSIRGWLGAVGEMEALTAIAGYSFEHPGDVFAELEVSATAGSGPVFDAEEMAHPLLSAARAIRNNVKLGDGPGLMVLSGPNMAGKSTFIRSVGVNAVLAQCGAPVRASRLRLSPLKIAASICILDSLSGGISRFYAEIHRIKLIFDLAGGPVPVLFLLDELLSGTNSHDRLAGSEFVVRGLMERKAIGMVTTHDLALARLPEELGDRAANFHFEDRYEEGKLIFDYKLKPGVVKTSNALELMRSIGLDVDAQRTT